MTRAISEGVRTAYRTYRETDYVPLDELGWDNYDARLNRYWQFLMYADNTVFTSIQKYAESQKATRKLYKHIRSIYNPVSRLINLEVAKVYGGNIDYADHLSGGAIPIVGADDALVEAIMQVFTWSNMGKNKNLFVRDGSTCGDSVLKVVDDRIRRKVRLEVVDPRKVREVELDEVGNVKAIVFEYIRTDEVTNKDYTYREAIDKEWFRTFRDGEPFAFYQDASGVFIPEWRNEYGFVPVRMNQHKDVGLLFGAPSFNTSLSKIDEMNDLASMIHDGIRKNISPPWAIAGDYQFAPSKGNKLTATADERDEQNIMKIPAGSQPHAMVLPLDLDGAMKALSELIAEVERDMPQLTLQRIRDKGGDASGVAIKNLYSDASDLLIELQGNYDASLVAATQMAISIGGFNRYDGFAQYGLDSYAAGDLDFTIKERPVFSDEFSPREKIDLLLQAADSPALTVVMRELDYSQEDIDEVVDAAAGREAAAMRGLAEAAFGNTASDLTDEATNGTDTQTNPTAAPASASSEPG